MNTFLEEAYHRLLDNTELSFKRYLYPQFRPGRLTGIIGPRGVGKTTLMLQYIKEHFAESKKVFYFSADSVYFSHSTLLAFVDSLYRLEGYRIFFIDEVHQYDNWSQEIKNLYDAFPDIRIIYSGSSMLKLTQGGHDLSRRTTVYQLCGLSFREYLNLTQGSDHAPAALSSLLDNPRRFNHLGSIDIVLRQFKQYLATGYYPFVMEDPHAYQQRVIRVIDKIVYEDIASYFDLKTGNLHMFLKILSFLASVPPGEVNTNNIANNMGVAHQTVSEYLRILESVGLIRMLYPFEGGNQYLRKPQKIFLHNTTLLHALAQFLGGGLNQGTLRELYFMQAVRDGGQELYYNKQGDFRTKDYMFEVGGKNKTGKQLAHASLPSWLVKDDVLTATNRLIPLMFFGFLY